MKCIIAGCIYKNEGYLVKAFENIKKIQSLFNETKIILAYDNSGDNTLKEICEIKKDKSFDIEIIINKKLRFNHPRCRAYNIAQARNQILDRIYNTYNNSYDTNSNDKYCDYNYFIFADLDDIFTFNIHPEILQKYIPKKYDPENIKLPDWDIIDYEWDSLTFYNKYYYDTWAVSIDHLQDSSWDTDKDGWEAQKEILTYLKETMDNLETNMRPIDSAFNGFAIHRLDKFKDIRFNPATILNNKLIIDCEWRDFYKQANKKGLKVMITKDCLFDPMKDVIPELYK